MKIIRREVFDGYGMRDSDNERAEKRQKRGYGGSSTTSGGL